MGTGTASFDVRHAFVSETTVGTTPTSPAWKTTHVPVKWEASSTRAHQQSQVAGGAYFGDALLTKDAKGTMEGPLVYFATDQFWESLLQSSWSSDAMTDGKAITAVSMETSFLAGVGGTRNYLRYRGVEAVGGTLKGKAGGEITFSFDLLGREAATATTSALSGATYSDPANKDTMSAATDFGTLSFAGFTLDEMESFDVNFTYSGRDPQRQMGSGTLNGITRGALTPAINAKFYVGPNFDAMRAAAMSSAQTPAKFTINAGSVTTKKYRWEFWDCYVDFAAMNFDQPTGFVDVRITPAYKPSNSGVVTMTRAIA
jgi:hypothetical protein